MLNLTTFKSTSSANGVRRYLEVSAIDHGITPEDYYIKQGGVPRELTGGLLPDLGMDQSYSAEKFEQLFKGVDANGVPLTQGKPETRRPGWDLTLSAPKSVSVAWALADDGLQKKIEAAHDKAVRETLGYIERNVNTASRGKTRKNRDGTITAHMEQAKVGAAIYRHGTSRECDPDLHSHMLIFNLAMRHDGSIVSLNTQELFQRKKELGAVYRVVLADAMRSIGFEIEKDRFAFKIKGIDADINDHFSTRRQQLEKKMADMGVDSPAASDIAAIATREPKSMVVPHVLKARWIREAEELGYTQSFITNLPNQWVRSGSEVDLTLRADFSNPPAPDTAYTSLNDLLDKATTHDSAFTEFAGRTTVLTDAQGKLSLAEAEEHIARFFGKRNRNLVLVQKDAKPFYTSKDMIRIESEFVEEAKNLDEAPAILISDQTIDEKIALFERDKDFNLSAEQVEAIRHVTNRTGRLALVQGDAGTGKSTALEVAARAWETAGLRVRPVAPMAKAAGGLKEVDAQSGTVAALIMKAKDWVNDKGETVEASDPLTNQDVIVVDEIGTIDSRTLHELVQLVSDAGAKLVGMGDIKQLQPVAAGGPFAALQKYTDIAVVNITQALRQKTERTKSMVRNILDKNPVDALSTLSAIGQFHQEADSESAVAHAISQWSQRFDLSNFESTVMITNTVNEVALLNENARDHLIDKGAISRQAGVKLEVLDSDGFSLGHKPFTEGDRITFLKNNNALGVENKLQANITQISTDPKGGHLITAETEKGNEVSFNTREYNQFDYGYAITSNGSQGMSVDHALIYVGEGVQNFHSSYVQFSRVKFDLSLVVNQASLDEFLSTIAPTEKMMKYARDIVVKQGLEPQNFAEQSFLDVRQFLNKYADNLREENTVASGSIEEQFSYLVKTMQREDIKPTTLDYSLGHPELGDTSSDGWLGKVDLSRRPRLLNATALLTKYEPDQNVIWVNRLWLPESDYKTLLGISSEKDEINKVSEKEQDSSAASEDTPPETNDSKEPVTESDLSENVELNVVDCQDVELETANDSDISGGQPNGASATTPKRKRSNKPPTDKMKWLAKKVARQLGMREPDFAKEGFDGIREFLNKHAYVLKDAKEDKEKDKKKENKGKSNKETASLVPKQVVSFTISAPHEQKEKRGLASPKSTNRAETTKVVTKIPESKGDTSHIGQKTNDSGKHHWGLSKLNATSREQTYSLKSVAPQLIPTATGQPVAHFSSEDIGPAASKTLGASLNDLAGIKEPSLVGQPGHPTQKMVNYARSLIARKELPDQKFERMTFSEVKAFIGEHAPQKQAQTSEQEATGPQLDNLNAHYPPISAPPMDMSYADSDYPPYLQDEMDDDAFSQMCEDYEEFSGHPPGPDGPPVSSDVSQETIKEKADSKAPRKPTDKMVAFATKIAKKLDLPTEPLKEQNFHQVRDFIQTHLESFNQKPSDKEQDRKAYWDLDRVQDALMDSADYYVESLISETKNLQLSKSGKVSVWGSNGSVKLNIDPGHKYFGVINDFERGIHCSLINYIAELSHENWKETVDRIARDLNLQKEDPNHHKARLSELNKKRTAEQAAKRKTAEAQEAKEKLKRIKRVQGIWSKTQPIAGTIGERYLQKIRHIPTDNFHDDIRFLSNAKDTVKDSNGNIKEYVTRPAVVFASRDKTGQITSVQQIYLDPETADKSTKAKVVKKSLGPRSGAAACVGAGDSNVVMFAEGPETGLSAAAAYPKANVYVSMGDSSNYSRLAHLADKHNTKEILLLADNDGSKSTGSWRALEKSAQALQEKGYTVKVTVPNLIKGKRKTDFNDVLKHAGLDDVRKQISRTRTLQSQQEKELGYER